MLFTFTFAILLLHKLATSAVWLIKVNETVLMLLSDVDFQ